jgi:hypothetical protein
MAWNEDFCIKTGTREHGKEFRLGIKYVKYFALWIRTVFHAVFFTALYFLATFILNIIVSVAVFCILCSYICSALCRFCHFLFRKNLMFSQNESYLHTDMVSRNFRILINWIRVTNFFVIIYVPKFLYVHWPSSQCQT